MTSQKKFYSLKAINLLLVIAMMLAGVAVNVSPVRAAAGEIVITAPAAEAKIPVKDGDSLTVQFTVDSTGKAGAGAYKILIGTTNPIEVGTYSVLFDGSEAQLFTRTITIPTMGDENEGPQGVTVKVKLAGEADFIHEKTNAEAVIVDNTAVEIGEIVLPEGQTAVKTGDEVSVSFTVDELDGEGKYRILVGSEVALTVDADVTFNGEFNQAFENVLIAIPSISPDGTYNLKVEATLDSDTEWASAVSGTKEGAVVVDNTAPAVIVLTAPNGGESWKIGSQHDIVWKADGGTDPYIPGEEDVTISLFYSVDGGGDQLIASEVSNEDYSWTVPVSATTAAMVKIEVVDAAGNMVSDQSNEVFTIYGVDNTPPTVGMTEPPAIISGTYTLTATAADTQSGVAGVLFQYSLDEGASWSDAGAGSLVSGSWQLAFNTASLPDGAVKFRAIATNGVGLSTTSAAVLAVTDNSDPIIHSFNLDDGDWIGAGFTFTVTASDAQSGITQMDVFESEDDGVTWEETAVCFVAELDDPDEFGVYTLECVDVAPVVLSPATTDIKVVVTNGAGLTAEEAHSVLVDLVAPTVTDALTAPVDNAVLHGGDPLEITWTGVADANLAGIDLELRIGTTIIKVIASGLANDGSFDWTVAGVPWAENYQVCLVAKDMAGNTNEDCNTDITIWGSDLTPPVVTLGVIDTPNTGEITLSAEASDAESGIQKIEFFVKPEDGDYDDALPRSVWDTAEPALNGVYFVKAVATNGAGVTGEDESGPILIDNTAPVVGDLSKAGNIYKVSASDAGSGIDSVVFGYADGTEWVEIGAGTLNPVSGKYESPAFENVDGVAVRAVATDNVGLNTLSVDYAPDATIDLLAGWNLISLPLIPDAPAIEDVLADLIARGSVKQVVGWVHEDGALVQKIWERGPLQTLAELDPEFGYWVEMFAEDEVYFDGSPMPAPPQAPPSYVVYAGWNLIGFKSEINMGAGLYLGEAGAGNMRAMYGWDELNSRYTPITIEDDLLPGDGYWLAVSTNATIYPPIAIDG